MASMSVTVNVRDLPDGLSIRVTEPKKSGRILIMIVTGIVAGYVLYRIPFSSPALRWLVGGAFVVGLVASVTAALQGCNVELRVNNLDLLSTGHAPEGYKASTMPRADVFRLEYRDAIRDVDSVDQAQGLYAERRGIGSWAVSTCILPQVDRAQTGQIIEAIYQRFPDTGTLSSVAGQPSSLISLNLAISKDGTNQET
jgi:hypothetical protein